MSNSPGSLRKRCIRLLTRFNRVVLLGKLYSGPLPAGTLPKWMTDTYELCTQDIQVVLAEQLSCSEFNGHFDYVPYRQFNGKGDRVWSNLMSATWADKQAVWPFSTV